MTEVEKVLLEIFENDVKLALRYIYKDIPEINEVLSHYHMPAIRATIATSPATSDETLQNLACDVNPLVAGYAKNEQELRLRR